MLPVHSQPNDELNDSPNDGPSDGPNDGPSDGPNDGPSDGHVRDHFTIDDTRKRMRARRANECCISWERGRPARPGRSRALRAVIPAEAGIHVSREREVPPAVFRCGPAVPRRAGRPRSQDAPTPGSSCTEFDYVKMDGTSEDSCEEGIP